MPDDGLFKTTPMPHFEEPLTGKGASNGAYSWAFVTEGSAGTAKLTGPGLPDDLFMDWVRAHLLCAYCNAAYAAGKAEGERGLADVTVLAVSLREGAELYFQGDHRWPWQRVREELCNFCDAVQALSAAKATAPNPQTDPSRKE